MLSSNARRGDWRLTVSFESGAHARRLFSALKAHAAAALAADRLKDVVYAEHEAEWLRVYAGSYAALRRAQDVVAGVIELWGLRAEELAEHRIGEQADWERVELPLPPAREDALVSEHRGEGPWGAEVDRAHRVQVHFELSSRSDAKSFARALADDGYDVHQHESCVFLFADDARSAHLLGAQLQQRAPPGAQLFDEGESHTTLVI